MHVPSFISHFGYCKIAIKGNKRIGGDGVYARAFNGFFKQKNVKTIQLL